MKKKLILGSALTILMCSSLITGATMALFGNQSEVNISVSGGKIDAVATIGSVTTYSGEGWQGTDTFENGGSATVDGRSLVLTDITPGDKAVVEVAIQNNSTVAAKYRVKLSGEGDAELLDQMLFGYSADGTNYEYYSNYTSAWVDFESRAELNVSISVELPEYVGNSAMEKTCSLAFSVEAVQANGVTDSESSGIRVYPVTTVEELNGALAGFNSGETILFYGGNWTEGATIAYEGDKILNVRGLTLDKLTVNAPEGTVYVYNDMNELEVVAVADQSLHIYGNIVKELTVQSGRAVVEEGASVAVVNVAPADEATVKVEVANQTEVESIVVNTKAGATAEVVIAEEVTVPSLEVKGEGGVKLENNGSVEDITVSDDSNFEQSGTGITASVVTNATELFNAFKLCVNTVVFGNDIELPEKEYYNWNSGAQCIDLNGYALSFGESEIWISGGHNLTIKNGNINANPVSNILNGGFTVFGGSKLVVENADYTSSGNGFYLQGKDATLEVIDCSVVINGYGVTTNASSSENHGVVARLTRSEFRALGEDSAGTMVLLNVPCQLYMSECTISGVLHGVVMRGGTANIEDSVISNTVEDDSLLDYFVDRNWGSGDMINIATLVLGNKGASSYQYPTECTLKNTTLISVGPYPAIYTYGNVGEGLGTTLTLEGSINITGSVIKGNDAVTIINNAADINADIGDISGAVISANNGGTVLLVDDIDELKEFGYTSSFVCEGSSASNPNTYGKNLYSYALRNIKFESLPGKTATVNGLNLISGKVSATDPNNSALDAYYTKLTFNGLSFRNIKFTEQVTIGSSTLGLTLVDGIVFDNCEFDMVNSEAEYSDAVIIKAPIGLQEGDVYFSYNVKFIDCDFVNCRRCIDVKKAKGFTIEKCTFVDCSIGLYVTNVVGDLNIVNNNYNNCTNAVYINTVANNYAAYDFATNITVTGNIMTGMTDSKGYFFKTRYDNGRASGKSVYTISGNYWGAAEGITAVEGFRITDTYGVSKTETILDDSPKEIAE